MSGAPWYKRYSSDFIAGTVGLTLEQKGAYSLILDVIYDRGGPVPDDARYWAGLCGCSVRKWNTIKTQLAAMGKIVVSEGMISNFRAEKEIENSQRTAEKHAKNGSKGGEKRAENERALSENNDLTQAGLKHTRINQKPDTRYQKEEDTPTGDAGVLTDHVPIEGKPSLEKQAYDLGKSVLGKSAGGVITRLKKHHRGDWSEVMATLRLAAQKSSPAEWVGAVLAGKRDAAWEQREAEIYAGVH